MNHHQQDCIEILVEKARRGQVSRRSFIKAMGILSAMPLAMRNGISWAADKPLVVVNWGGDAIKSFNEAFSKSFTAETGIPVKIDGSGPTEGAIRTQVKSGRPSWDCVDAEPFSAEALGREGVLQPIDYSIVDKSKVFDGLANEYGIAGYMYSYVLAWDTEVFGANGPKDWKDFWDVKKFPGKRTMYKWMNGVLEMALLADGVAPADLYPLDVARAFAKLEELKPHMLAYWGSGAESQQLLLNGEVAMGAIWNTRATLLEKDSEGRIAWSFDNAIVQPSAWGVLAGNPAGKDAAMQYINHALNPAGQVELLKLMGNGTTNPAAQPLLTAELKRYDAGAPENVAVQHKLNIEWYVDNYGPTLDKFLGLIGG